MIGSPTSRLAMRVAEAAIRRDVSSRVVNGIVAAARMLAGFAGGASAWVPSDVQGVFAMMLPSCRFVAKSGCNGETWCIEGDPMGCNIKGEHDVPVWGVVPGVPGADMVACPVCARHPGCAGDTPIIKKWWSCCCNNRLTLCVDCTTTGHHFTCICAFQSGQC
jgi:hypothetical protein